MQEYSIAVIGAGPAGMMAAICAASPQNSVVILEKNNSAGRKLLISGKGRCNLTNIGDLDNFLEHFCSNAEFLRSAFHEFFNNDLIKFFEDNGLELKTERGGRVFPLNDESKAVLDVLIRKLKEKNVHLLCKTQVSDLQHKSGQWIIELADSKVIRAKKLILATGGASYPLTGSTGDGFKFAKKLGHKIIPLRPGLVPLEVREDGFRTWQV
jgi:Predicted flavoproteins